MADENEVEEEKKSSIVPMILVGVVCIALGAGGTFFAVGGSDESPASSETSDVEGSADGSTAGASGGGTAVPFICTPPIGSYPIN